MGVHNLWELLAPVGRRVSVETLAGKRLAIDASIWMIQFMKAMRDEKGEMVKNAHILGFFRRICKLLFLRTKPVFVFDGATPALKRRTVIARRRQRENAQTKIRKTAEKLLLNHLKTMRLQELAEDLENQRQKNDAKGKRKITDKASTDVHSSEGTETIAGSYNQEAIDELLAASLAAEDNDRQMNHTSTSAAGIPYEEEDGEEDEEMILPTMHGKVDPAVLAALPPSMQLDLFVQMRERMMAENRQKYQKVKKAPERFSELQIQAYLKTVALRRDIDEVRKSASGRGIGGVQTSRIASEANREFIFSSSFTGDKHVLASAGVDQSSIAQRHTPSAPPDASDSSVPTKNANAAGSAVDQSSNAIDDDIETYLDERGRVRVSRVRAMGLCMTRDLQRNLDMMKESELESLDTTQNTRNMSMLNESIVGVSNKLPSKVQLRETLDQGNDEPVTNNRNEELVNLNGTPIEVSFDDNGTNRDDDLFTRLVAGDSDLCFVSDEKLLKSQSSDSVSDCDWEEGVVGEKNTTLNHNVEVGTYTSITESREIELEWVEELSDVDGHASACPSNYKEIDLIGDDGSNVEWEDGSSDIPGHTLSCQPTYKEAPSKGAMEEEMNFQEAIRRSLEDSRCEKRIDSTSEDENLIKGREVVNDGLHLGSVHHVKDCVQPKVSAEYVLQPIDSEVSRGGQRLNNVGKSDILKTNDSPSIQSEQSVYVDSDNAVMLIGRVGDNNNQNIHPDLGQIGSGSGMLCGQDECVELTTPTEENEVDLVKKKSSHSSSQIGQVHSGKSCTPAIASHSSDSLSVDLRVTVDDAQKSELETPAKEHLADAEEVIKSFDKESFHNNTLQSFAEVDNGDVVKNRDDLTGNSVIIDSLEEQVEKAKANLEEEMQRLGKERTTLGVEQRNLERNAEAVSSEMFAECQELLQMFGLPYIIAPMEAEAQCAFMELENLVDGVVTDDSDVFLFGARSVYKNIFDDRKYVETYFMKDIENELGLTREKIIRMALLLGSDYTEGVSGIGIVNAIEVINAFPEEDGLHQFREWIESPDPSILGKVNLPARSSLGKRALKAEDCIRNSSNSSAEDAVPVSEKDSPDADLLKMKQQFMDKHRNVSKNWHIPSTFPSEAVITEYNSPQVDKSTETFSWGKPDLFVLRKLCWEKFGWGTQKADDLLVPVLKEYNKHETQLRLEAFYTFNERFAKIRSKRIKKAVKGTSGNHSSELMDDTVQDISESKKRRKRKNSSQAGSGEHVSITGGDVVGHKTNSQEAPTASQSKRSVLEEPCTPEGGNQRSLMQTVERQNTRGSTSRGSGRSGGRGRGRGRGRSVKQGRSKESSGLEYGESSSDEENDNDSQQDLPDENYDGSHELRRSTRPRKAVRYTVNNIDIDKLATTNQDSGDSADGERELLGNSGSGTAFAVGTRESKQYNFDPLLVENCTDDLQREGGNHKAELNIATGQIGDEHLNADQDYLRMGGGFCLEDDEVDKDTRGSADSSTSIISDSDNPSAFTGETEADIKYDASQSVLNSGTVDDTQAGGHTGTPSDMQTHPDVTDTIDKNDSSIMSDKIEEGIIPGVKFLSAMPNLRRKRRRS